MECMSIRFYTDTRLPLCALQYFRHGFALQNKRIAKILEISNSTVRCRLRELAVSNSKQPGLRSHYPGAAASLLEGLEETFTINRLELPASLRRCLAITNIIESSYSGVRMRTRRVSRWKNGTMVLRWVASAFLAAEKSFRRIQGYRDLWMLKARLGSHISLEAKAKVA